MGNVIFVENGIRAKKSSSFLTENWLIICMS